MLTFAIGNDSSSSDDEAASGFDGEPTIGNVSTAQTSWLGVTVSDKPGDNTGEEHYDGEHPSKKQRTWEPEGHPEALKAAQSLLSTQPSSTGNTDLQSNFDKSSSDVPVAIQNMVKRADKPKERLYGNQTG